MANDIQIITDKEGEVKFDVHGSSEDTGLMLLQRLYVLLMSDQDSSYRPANASYSLLAFLDGANFPGDGAMNAILAICCSNAVSMLDAADRARITSFNGQCVDGLMTCTLKLTDGTTIKGALTNA